MIFMDKKNYTHVFSHNKKLKVFTEVKENNVAVNCTYDQILSDLQKHKPQDPITQNAYNRPDPWWWWDSKRQK